MERGLRYIYDPKSKDLIQAVCEGFDRYCKIYRSYPKTLYIPYSEAGYMTELLEVHLNSILQPGEIILGAGIK